MMLVYALRSFLFLGIVNMRAIRRLNNNVIVCLTAKGNEVIARGKGIGFHEMPYEVPLASIERTYYDIDEKYLQIIESIDDTYIQLAGMIVDYSKKVLKNQVNGNIIFTLADHLQFSVQRYKNNLQMQLPILYDIQHLYPEELDVGKYALSLLKKKLKQSLPYEEAAFIALHFINAESQVKQKGVDLEKRIVNDITRIIEAEYGMEIHKDSFSYSRFVSHMNYLLKRSKNNEMIQTENIQIYNSLKQDCPKAYLSSEKVSDYFKDNLSVDLTDEEKLYLILHINRLCSCEECYQ